MKRPNLQIVVIEDGQEIKTTVISNLFHKIITANFPNLEEEKNIHVQGAYTMPHNQNQNQGNKKHCQTHHNLHTQHREQRKTTECCK
jgi:hypothetical protein